MIRRPLIISIFVLCFAQCQKKPVSISNILLSNDSSAVNFIGDNFISAFKQHVFTSYSGIDLRKEVQQSPFLFYHHDRVFKMDIDTIISYNDSLLAVRFHGALDTAIRFSCHICSAPQALGIFVKRGSNYFPKDVVDVSEVFTCPWGASSDLELHFENTFWPGPMLFSTYTDGGQGNFYEYTHGVDLSIGSLGFERFRFSNTIRREQTYFPQDEFAIPQFSIARAPTGWKEAFKIIEVDLDHQFDESNASFDIIRNTNTHWTLWYGPNEENQLKIVVSKFQDTLKYTLQGGIFSPL